MLRTLCAAVLAAALLVTAAPEHYHAVRKGAFQFDMRKGFSSSDAATVRIDRTHLSVGWDVLWVSSNSSYPDAEQAYAAGFLEGKSTASAIWMMYNNTFVSMPATKKSYEWLDKNFAWTQSQIYANNATSDWWFQIGIQFNYFMGLTAGVMSEPAPAGQSWTIAKGWSLAAMADLMDIEPAVNVNAREDWTKMSKKHYDSWFAQKTHCSSLFKVLGDMSDIYFGHATWFNFNEAYRVFKHVTLNINHHSTSAKTISYSSYPGVLSSLDDFYLMDSGIASIETSFSILNYSAYDGKVPSASAIYWLRVMAANRAAPNAPKWTEVFSRHNSGTYNNQWMILDLNLFEPGKDLKPNTLWVAEQIPGLVASQDVTNFLRYGYYPSYNVPMNKTVFEIAGYAEGVKQQGPEMNDYQMCVRAQIFRRDQGKVTDMDSYKFMMQYNDYEQDPISNGNPVYAIAARGDLDADHPQCFGALDAKVSSWSRWKAGMTVDAFSGPTPQQQTFGFNYTFANCPVHAGVPEVFDFGWQKMQPHQ